MSDVRSNHANDINADPDPQVFVRIHGSLEKECTDDVEKIVYIFISAQHRAEQLKHPSTHRYTWDYFFKRAMVLDEFDDSSEQNVSFVVIRVTELSLELDKNSVLRNCVDVRRFDRVKRILRRWTFPRINVDFAFPFSRRVNVR